MRYMFAIIQMSHEDTKAAYAKLKRELAKKYPYDIDGYCDGKEKFVKEVEAKALDWKNK